MKRRKRRSVSFMRCVATIITGLLILIVAYQTNNLKWYAKLIVDLILLSIFIGFVLLSIYVPHTPLKININNGK